LLISEVILAFLKLNRQKLTIMIFSPYDDKKSVIVVDAFYTSVFADELIFDRDK
jgi:hypothetical protein